MVDRMEAACGIDDQVLGLQVAVGPVIRDHGKGQPVEGRCQSRKPLPVAVRGGVVDRLAECSALDPLVEDDIDPFARRGGGVEVEFPFEKALAVDLPQVAHRP